MSILYWVVSFYGFLGTTASVAGGINKIISKVHGCSADDLFIQCFIRAVNRNSTHLSKFAENGDPKRIKTDKIVLETVVKNWDCFMVVHINGFYEYNSWCNYIFMQVTYP